MLTFLQNKEYNLLCAKIKLFLVLWLCKPITSTFYFLRIWLQFGMAHCFALVHVVVSYCGLRGLACAQNGSPDCLDLGLLVICLRYTLVSQPRNIVFLKLV